MIVLLILLASFISPLQTYVLNVNKCFSARAENGLLKGKNCHECDQETRFFLRIYI